VKDALPSPLYDGKYHPSLICSMKSAFTIDVKLKKNPFEARI